MTELSLVIPREWATGSVLLAEPIAESDDGAVLVTLFLSDGSSVLALAWEDGHAIARTSPATDWAIEERYEGQTPHEAGESIARMWKIAVQALIEARQMAEAEFGSRPSNG